MVFLLFYGFLSLFDSFGLSPAEEFVPVDPVDPGSDAVGGQPVPLAPNPPVNGGRVDSQKFGGLLDCEQGEWIFDALVMIWLSRH